MRYLVVTAKHHDGFCLWDSKVTTYDIVDRTPFKRDVIGELSEACKRAGIRFCVYYSIMDWHHPDAQGQFYPDYNNTESRNPNFPRYVSEYLKPQLRELITQYSPLGVLWFDGEWIPDWTETLGKEIYDYCRSLQPDLIINNRVGKTRMGMQGFSRDPNTVGDYGTPEQEIPATGLVGVDWESCMPMNDTWGYKISDSNWKSSQQLLQNLVDIVSKGGNYLLNVGPKADGTIPTPSVERLKTIGEWMQRNGEAIYGTTPTPFKYLPWGRCTQKTFGETTRLYFHVFEWPKNGKLFIPGLLNSIQQAFILSAPDKKMLQVKQVQDGVEIRVPFQPPHPFVSVIAVDILGKPEVINPPEIITEFDQFTDSVYVELKSSISGATVHYMIDGSEQDNRSPSGSFFLKQTAIVKARTFRDGKPVGHGSQVQLKRVIPKPSLKIQERQPGLQYRYYEGQWEFLPDFETLTPVKTGILPTIDLSCRNRGNYFGIVYEGSIHIPETGGYEFSLASDDGSRLLIDQKVVVDNDGLHGVVEKEGKIALEAGFHSIRILFFEASGGEELFVYMRGPGIQKQALPDSKLFH